MKINLIYIELEDRLRIDIILDESSVNWWLTRKLSLNLLIGLAEKLQEIALPQVNFYTSKIARNILQEHTLALEFDGPLVQKKSKKILNATKVQLIKEINLKLNSVRTTLKLRGAFRESSLNISRRETHAFIQMLHVQCTKAGWLEAAKLPDWLVEYQSTVFKN